MFIDFLLNRFASDPLKEAIVWHDLPHTYQELSASIRQSLAFLEREEVSSGTVVGLEADFSPAAVGLLLALIEHACIIVPLTKSVEGKRTEFVEIAEVETRITVSPDESISVQKTGISASNELIGTLKTLRRPGLVLFSSGSSGKSKAALHDFVPLLEKFRVPRNSQRTVAFLLFDHIGGMNTLFYSLSNTGCLIFLSERAPDPVSAAIARHRAEVLPTSPTFINLLLLSEAYTRHDLSSLKLITYGTEVMPEGTLQRCREAMPNVRLLQTYGLSELGILRSKSKSSDSLWVKIGGEGFQTRVVEGMLEIKAQSAMLGYLNAPSPFTHDGWFKTGDSVEVDGEYFRILGRQSELVNIGGEKVFPAEVESILQEMEGVDDVVVTGEPNPITGQILVARVKLATNESLSEFRGRMRANFQGKVARYKIPQKVLIVNETLHSDRFKKMRNLDLLSQ